MSYNIRISMNPAPPSPTEEAGPHNQAESSTQSENADKRYLMLLPDRTQTNKHTPSNKSIELIDSQKIDPTFADQKEAVERFGKIFRLENRIHTLSLLIAQAEYMMGIRKVVQNEIMRYFWESEMGHSQFWKQKRLKEWFSTMTIEDDERCIALDREYLNELRERLEKL